jgi:hypothetical protein
LTQVSRCFNQNITGLLIDVSLNEESDTCVNGGLLNDDILIKIK